MIRSMTAFARRENANEWGILTWELRSVNHRYLETSLRVPDVFRGLEAALRERISQSLSRGKVDCTLKYQPGDNALATITLNKPLAERLLTVANELEQVMEVGTGLGTIDVLRWPGVVTEPEPDLGPLKNILFALLDEALQELVDTRKREGERIAQMITQRCTAMTECVQQVRQKHPQVITKIRDKLLSRLQDLPLDADPGRLEQEMAIIAQRLDIAEDLIDLMRI